MVMLGWEGCVQIKPHSTRRPKRPIVNPFNSGIGLFLPRLHQISLVERRHLMNMDPMVQWCDDPIELPYRDTTQKIKSEIAGPQSLRREEATFNYQQQHHHQPNSLPHASNSLLFGKHSKQQQQLQSQTQQRQETAHLSASPPPPELAPPLIALPLNQQNPKIITRSQSTKVIQELQYSKSHNQHSIHQLKQQQSLPATFHLPIATPNVHSHHSHASKSVSILVYKTLNTVFRSSRKIIVRVCEVANAKKTFTMFKFSKAAAQNRAENRANACTGHDQFVRPPVPEKKVKHIMKKLHKQNGLKRSNSAIEFDVSALTAANRRHLYSRNRSASSEQDNSDQSEHSEKSPLVSARLDNLARIFFSKSMPAETGSRDTIESVLTTRPNLKYQYSALDSGNGIVERSPRERAQRERALNTVQEWIQSANGRYEIIAHLDEIGSRHGKNWFLITDSSVRTDRLLSLLPLPADCVAFEDLPANENLKSMLMELLGSLHHPYIYPVLDLGFLSVGSSNFACLVTPFNSRGSLKDLIYKTQWNEPWVRKYTRKPNGLPITQVQRLGRQILEALLFLKERGFPLHGHLHSGNVILQNGAARLSGLENGLLGLSSRINAIMWSRSTTEIENVDIICFGHLLYEMCTGQEMTTPKPSMRVLEMELEHYPQILDILGLIFEPPSGVCPSVEDLVLCDLFRSIDLRELRGPCFNTIKPSLSRSTLNLLHTVKKRQCASLGNSISETSSPNSPPSTPRGNRRGISRTMDSFDISSDSEEGLLDEIIVDSNYHQKRLQQLHHMQYYHQQQCQHHPCSADYANTSASYSQYPQQQHQQYTSQRSPSYEAIESPIHYCENTSQSDDNSYDSQENQPHNYQTPQHKAQQHQPHKLPLFLRCDSSAVTAVCTDKNLIKPSKGVTVSEVASTNQSSESSSSLDSTPATTFILDDRATYKPTVLPEVQDNKSNDTNDETSGISSPNNTACIPLTFISNSTSMPATAGASFNHQLTADICSYKNSKSRRLEYSLKCLKYGRSNPSQDSAFGSLTDNDFSVGSSSFRISSFQSISSPIDEGAEDVIIATTTGGKETCLELTTIPRNMVSQDSAISSPCRETSPNHFLNIDDGMSGSCSGGSSSSGSTGNIRPQQFPVSLSPKILVTATTNSSNSSLSSASAAVQQTQSFDPPKILVNDQNSIYTTSPSKRSGTIEVFSQKYRVSSFEDMSPNKHSTSDKHLKNFNRMAFRSLEEEQRIDSAFMPITDRTKSENRVNILSEKYKKLTHASFRISKTSSQVAISDISPGQVKNTVPTDSTTMLDSSISDIQRPATATGSISSRQTMWRDSKFYRKNRIAKSNDSLVETSPKHSMRLTPSSLRENHYDSTSSYSSRSYSRQSLNRDSSINEISGLNQTLDHKQGFALTTSFCGSDICPNGRHYCSSKSEDLGESNEYLPLMDTRKSCSERHLVTLTQLKQTAINNTVTRSGEQCCFSEDEMSFNNDNNAYGFLYNHEQSQQHDHKIHQPRQHHYKQQVKKQQQQVQHNQEHYPKRPHPNQLSWSSCSINCLKTSNIKTTSLATLSCHQNLAYSASVHTSDPSSSADVWDPAGTGPDKLPHVSRSAAFRSLDQALDIMDCSSSGGGSGEGYVRGGGICIATEENSSPEDSPSHQALSGAELSKMFVVGDAQGSSCNEEETPLLGSIEMSPISPTQQEQSVKDEKM